MKMGEDKGIEKGHRALDRTAKLGEENIIQTKQGKS